MSDLQTLITQYKLSKTGDKNAIRGILSNMGDGKLLKSDLSFELLCLFQLAEQSDENAYKSLCTLKEVGWGDKPLYFEPDYIKEEKRLVEEAQILTDAKAWKEKKKRAEELRQKEEEARKRKEEDELKKAQEKEARRLAKIEAEERERQLQEQKELEFVEHLKTTAIETICKIVRDMVFIEGGNALLGSVNNSSNPPHMENIESFWIKKHSITRDEMEKLLIDYSVSSENVGRFVMRLSKILDCTFDIPTATQLEYAMRAKDKNYVPSNSIIRQIGDDRMIEYRASSEIVKGSKVLVVKDLYKPIFSLENKTSADSFRIICSDSKLREIKEKFI